MNSLQHKICGITTIMLILFDLIFIIITLFLNNIWLFLLSLFLMVIFFCLRVKYNKIWYEEIGKLEYHVRMGELGNEKNR